MKKKFALFGMMILLVMAAVACGAEPVTVGDQVMTREAQATEAAVEREEEIAEKRSLLERIAPPDTNVDEAPVGNQHDAGMVYEFEALPPNGGVHNPTWQKCQVYDEPVKPQHAIHSMEHGAVWIAYQPDLDEGTVSDIEKLARRQPFALVSPYPNLQSALVLTAWGIQMEADSPDDPRVQLFLDAYLNGPQTPEPGATCTTGTTETVALES